MKIGQYAATNSKNDVNASLDAIFSALVGVGKVDIVAGVTGGANGAFSVSHKLGRAPEFFIAQGGADCRFWWTSDDQAVTRQSKTVLVAHASAAATPFVALVLSRFE